MLQIRLHYKSPSFRYLFKIMYSLNEIILKYKIFHSFSLIENHLSHNF